MVFPCSVFTVAYTSHIINYLIATDGDYVYEAAWYAPDGFMIHAKCGWQGVYNDQENWWWADIRQTVRGDSRFKGLFIDDLVDDFKEQNI